MTIKDMNGKCKHKGCPTGAKGVPIITSNLVSLFTDLDSNYVFGYVNNERYDFKDYIDFSYEDGILDFKINIKAIEKKHDTQGYQVHALFSNC